MKLERHKVRKVTELDFLKNAPKNEVLNLVYLFECKINSRFLTICKNHTSGKNLVFELCSKNLETTENARFFKLQYLTN